MPLRWQEVALPLVLIVFFIVLKHIPSVDHLPLARAAGVVSFGAAIFIALRLVQSETAISIDGWSELRPSLVEYFAIYGGALLSAALMAAVIHAGWKIVDPTEMVAAFIASVSLAGGSAALAFGGLFERVRWNNKVLEHRSAFGRQTEIAWAEVIHCEPSWRGVKVTTHDGRQVSFSQLHSGAAELARHATYRARRNAETATKAFAAL